MKSKIAAPVIAAIIRAITEALVSAGARILLVICRLAKAPAIPIMTFLTKSSRPSLGVLALVAKPNRIPVTIVMTAIKITGLILGR